MKITYRQFLVLTFNILVTTQMIAQQENHNIRTGFIIGVGKQPFYPFTSPDYIYSVKGYKFLINYHLKTVKRICYELQIEPGIYSASHQLLTEDFVQPKDGPDYLEQRKIFMKKKTITEYALNVGMQIRYSIREKFSLFVLVSTGPMISDTATERLAKGFAFSDIIAIGAAYKTGRIMFEIRPGLRHVSNANLKKPNSGHNSTNIDFGISVSL